MPIANADEVAAIAHLEHALDKYALAIADINPESRVKGRPEPAKLELVEAGTRIFLVKVSNQAGVTTRLEVESPNALAVDNMAICREGTHALSTTFILD